MSSTEVPLKPESSPSLLISANDNRVYFFSYARSKIEAIYQEPNDDPKLFESDLKAAIEQRFGPFKASGFIDYMGKSGEWKETLVKGLADHPIGIVAATPEYFETNKAWCAWEFRELTKRNKAFKAASLEIDSLLLVPWLRVEKIPIGVSEISFCAGFCSQFDSSSFWRSMDVFLNPKDGRGLAELRRNAYVERQRVALMQYDEFLYHFSAYVRTQFLRVQDLLSTSSGAVFKPEDFRGDEKWTWPESLQVQTDLETKLSRVFPESLKSEVVNGWMDQEHGGKAILRFEFFIGLVIKQIRETMGPNERLALLLTELQCGMDSLDPSLVDDNESAAILAFVLKADGSTGPLAYILILAEYSSRGFVARTHLQCLPHIADLATTLWAAER